MALIEKTYDLDSMSLTISINGEDITFATEELTDEIKQHLMLHGLSQKLGDSIAGLRGKLADSMGRTPTDDELNTRAKEILSAVWSQLKSGEWRASRGEASAAPRVSEVALAISRLRNLPIEQVQKILAETPREKISAWRKHPQMQAAIAQIRAERAAERLAAVAGENFDPFA